MGLMEKIQKFSAENQRRKMSGNGDSGRRLRDIFHRFHDGDNIIRLVDEFVVVKTHFVMPDQKTGQRGLCVRDAFQSGAENRLPAVVNCADWDIENECETEEKTCLICKLNAIAKTSMKDDSLTADERQYYTNLIAATNARTAMKWNIIDRDDPYVTEVIDDEEKKVLGYKIATIGMEAWFDIEGIFKQCGFNIADSKDGIDICVTRGRQGQRVSYSAQAVIKGVSVKTSPLTDDEKEMELNDIKRICGRVVDQDHLLKYLHNDYQMTLAAVSDDDLGKVVKVTFPKKKPAQTPRETEPEPDEDVDDVDDEGMAFECFGNYVEGDVECSKCESAQTCREEQNKK